MGCLAVCPPAAAIGQYGIMTFEIQWLGYPNTDGCKTASAYLAPYFLSEISSFESLLMNTEDLFSKLHSRHRLC